MLTTRAVVVSAIPRDIHLHSFFVAPQPTLIKEITGALATHGRHTRTSRRIFRTPSLLIAQSTPLARMKQPDIAHGGSSVPESVAGAFVGCQRVLFMLTSVCFMPGVQPDVGGLQSGALSLLPQDHPNCDMALNNLADALMARYQQTGDTQMISEMIRLRRQVLALRPPGYPDRDRSIMMLNIVLMIHLQHAGETETLSEIICLHREALALRPQGHRLRAGSLFSLAGALVLHYKQAGEVYILEEAICLSREALELLPQGHSVRGKLLRHLASVLSLHYEHSGDMEELAETIFLHKEVLLLCPKGHPDRRHALSDLGYELMIHYEQAGDVNTLEEAICLYRESLSLSPLGDPDRGSRLYNLSRALVIHFELTGDMDALAQSIYLQRDALVWYPHDHTQHGIMLNHLASALMRRYQRTGDMDVLGEAICLHRKALALHPKGHPSRILSLNNLALALRVSFEYDCDRDTLTEMVLLLREALALSPTNHPDRGQWLSNLAGVLWMCGEVTWDIDVLADSISLCRETLALYPKGHSIRSLLLSSLATVLSSRYKISGDTDALAESIHLNEEALTLCPQGHPDRGMILKSLAATYRNQFERDNDFDALSVAHKLQKEELDSWPEGHPNRHESHHLIARVQLLESSTFNWMEAFEHLKEAATDNSTSPSNRLSSAIVSLKWVEAMPAHISLQHSFSQRALDIYVLIIQLLPCAARVGLDLSTRLRKLSGSEQLCRAASTRAMLLQQLPMAIEVFEEGKAVFWSQLLRLRSTALDALPSSERKMLSNLFRSLEKDSGILMGDLQDNARIESQIEHRRQLNQQADSLIEDIRMRPGFEHFLKVPQYDKLAQAATNGFVVVLIANEPLFFAIVIHADDVLEHVPLPSVKGDMLRKLQAQVSESGMRDYTHASEGRGHNTMSRGISKEKTPTHTPLALMWKTIIQPIISHIGLKASIVQLLLCLHV